MTPTLGSRFGPYEILSRIGGGGMGEVWKARDSRLNRIVAIKTSAAKFSDRFAQEARAIAALNHPHICTLYDIGPDYLVMEFVDGAEIKGPIPLDQTLKLAIQLASALEAAHRTGITHRDLKPANILVTKAGIKVLDFGLAKFEAAKPDSANDETLTRALTQEGTIVGTLQYMAPEQLQGKPVDARADFFSFGCVLYEMLTGSRAFDATNTASLIAAIMERDPPSVEDVAPASLDWLLKRCLAKDPEERWQTARDLRAALERIAVIATEVQAIRPSRLPMLGWGLAAMLAIVAGTLALLHFRDPPVALELSKTSIEPPPNLRFAGVSGTPPAISPDGKQIVFEALSADGKRQLWLRPLDYLTARPLPGAEAGIYPFWSPDSKSMGFFSGGKLRRIEVSGGPVTTLADAPGPRGGTWNRNGIIVFAPTTTGGMKQIPASGGTVIPAGKNQDPEPKRFPWFLPDGLHFIYLAGNYAGGGQTIRIGSLNTSTQDLTLDGGVDSFAIYSKGYLLFVKGSSLVARPFDAKSLEFTGAAAPLAAQTQTTTHGTLNLAPFSASPSGSLVYLGGIGNLRLTWMDRAGKRVQAVGEAAPMGDMALSPDRKIAAVGIGDADNNQDIWLYDLSNGLRTRFTFDPAMDLNAAWSPDGRTIVFRSSRLGQFDLYRKPADGSRSEELLYKDDLLKGPSSFTPDGKYLAYWTSGDAKTGYDIWILPDPLGPAVAAKPHPFLRTEFDEINPRFSPDGRWMAYQSNESGKNEIYVIPFPGTGGKRQVSIGGGSSPLWRTDGKELYYLAADNRLMAAEVNVAGGVFEVSGTTTLFELTLSRLNAASYDVSADGQRFLVPMLPEGEAPEPLTIVQNWTAGLKK